MILPLRQRHRRLFAVLGVLLPLALALGIAARKPVPNVAFLPAELAAPQNLFTATVGERRDLFEKAPVQVRLLRENGGGRFAVALSAARDFVRPDLMVYWVAGNRVVPDSLPDEARLLGAFSVTALPLPADAATTGGVLVLYSLADNEVVGVSKPILF